MAPAAPGGSPDPQPRRAGGAPDGEAGEGHGRSIRGNGRPGDPRPYGRGCRGHGGIGARARGKTSTRSTVVAAAIAEGRSGTTGRPRRARHPCGAAPRGRAARTFRVPRRHDGSRCTRPGAAASGPVTGAAIRCAPRPRTPRHTHARPAEPKSTGSVARGVVHPVRGRTGRSRCTEVGRGAAAVQGPERGRSGLAHAARSAPAARPPSGFPARSGPRSRTRRDPAGLSRGPESGAHDDDRHIREP